MFSKSRKKVKRSFFSLLELLIVIGIMGALTALILPQFSNAEDNAKDTGCDYNNAGTLRYVSMFRGANGVYPTGFHTGLNASDSAADDPVSAMADVTKTNLATATPLATEALATAVNSLKKAGIETLAYGTDVAGTPGTILNASANWDDDGSTFTIKGKSLAEYATDFGSDYAVVPLFVASTVDWEETASGKESPVNIALEGKCPWLEGGSFRYYICFFKVDTNSTVGDEDATTDAAKLLGTACPECGSLDADFF